MIPTLSEIELRDAPTVGPEMIGEIESIGEGLRALAARQERLADLAGIDTAADASTWLDVFNGYVGVLAISFLITLVATPVMRHLALANGVIDHPSDPRKVHRMPIAYLGGAAVYLGIMGGIFFSYLGVHNPFPYLSNASLAELQRRCPPLAQIARVPGVCAACARRVRCVFSACARHTRVCVCVCVCVRACECARVCACARVSVSACPRVSFFFIQAMP